MENKMTQDLLFEKTKIELNNAPYITDSAIGLKYEVPCMRGLSGEFWPIIPLVHDDTEVGFPHFHVHFDFRFFYEFELKWFATDTFEGKTSKYSFVKILKRKDIVPRFSPDTFSLELRIESRYCFRNPGVPTDRLCGHVKEGVKHLLEDEDRNKKHLEAGVCPHKGHKFSCSSIRGRKGQEVLHCPLHGLKFKMKDGKLLHCGKKPDTVSTL